MGEVFMGQNSEGRPESFTLALGESRSLDDDVAESVVSEEQAADAAVVAGQLRGMTREESLAALYGRKRGDLWGGAGTFEDNVEAAVKGGGGAKRVFGDGRGHGGSEGPTGWQWCAALSPAMGGREMHWMRDCPVLSNYRLQGTRKHVHILMPVASELSRIQYSGNNSSTTSYAVPFYFLANGDINVILTDSTGSETELSETTHYVLAGAGTPSGGSLTTVSPYSSSHTLTIYREPQQTQSTEFQSTGALSADTLTRGLDKLTMLVQSLSRKVSRCFRFNDKADDVAALSEGGRENTVLGFDSSGAPVLRDRTLLASLLSLGGNVANLSTTYWADDGERSIKVPDFTGQLGLQLDSSALYGSTGTSAGNWSLLLLSEDAMSSDSTLRPPSQHSVKAYVDAKTSTAEDYANAADAVYLPPGVITSYAGAIAPAGWLFCYGQAVSRVAYAALFVNINTTYGSGDGVTTFNLPDLRGRSIFGKDDMGGVSATRLTDDGTGNPGIDGTSLGAAGGMDRYTLTEAQMPNHTHQLNNATSVWTQGSGSVISGTSGFSGIVTITANSAGFGEAHPILPPAMVLNYIIRT